MIIAPGTDGTLKSTTVEDTLIEVLFIAREQEKNQPEDTRMSLSIDINQGVLNYQGSLEITALPGNDGKPVINAIEYLLDNSYV